MAKRHERTLARQMAVKALYERELMGDEALEGVRADATLPDEHTALEVALLPYTCELLFGVRDCKEQIDSLISGVSENWALSRMPIVDRAIMRLAVYEMLHVEDVPVSVAINEAVEMAKQFGGDDESGRFVNGVLGKIARQCEAGQAAVDGEAATAPSEGKPESEDVAVAPSEAAAPAAESETDRAEGAFAEAPADAPACPAGAKEPVAATAAGAEAPAGSAE